MTPERVISDLRACVSVGSPPDLATHIHPRAEIARRIWAAIDLIDRLATDLNEWERSVQHARSPRLTPVFVDDERKGCDSP